MTEEQKKTEGTKRTKGAEGDLNVMSRFILIVQQVVVRLTLIVILAMDYNILWF